MSPHFDRLFTRFPSLDICRTDLENSFTLLVSAFSQGKKLLLCGNGGSASDAEHISGELMKSFLLPRPIPIAEQNWLRMASGEDMGLFLQSALPAFALTGQISLSTAVANDNRPDMIFAQQVYGLGNPGDVLLGISTSGNSSNVVSAFHVAKLKGLRTIALTGESGGRLKQISDLSICAPAHEVMDVQELHLPIYHALCARLEEEFFGSAKTALEKSK